MTSFAISHWDYASNAERRYKRISTILIVLYIILGIIIPFIHLVGLQEGGGDAGKMRYAQLLKQPKAPVAAKQQEPAPTPEKKPVPEPPKPQKQTQPKPTPTPPPTHEMQVEHARQVAQHSGLLALSKDLANLSSPVITASNANRRSAAASAGGGGAVSAADAAAFSATAGDASGGITTTTQGTADRRDSGTRLDQRRTASVESPIGFGRDKTKPGQGGDRMVAGRTLEEIQLTFDRSKAAFYAIFNRAMRENANMGAGKIVVSLTIAPDGSVTSCTLVSSTFSDPDLANKVVQRVKLLNFGAKNVPAFTYPNYPINFLPS